MSSTDVTLPRRRHRGRRALAAFIVIVVVLVALFFVADYVAKRLTTDYIQQQVATALGLSSTAPVSVNLGTGSILLQAVSGSIDSVGVAVDPLEVDGLTGSATLNAEGVPLSSTTPVRQLHVQVNVPEDTIAKAIGRVPSLAAFKPTVTIAGQRVELNGTISSLGFVQHIGVSMVPEVSSGEPGLSIKTATFDGATISISQLDNYVPGLADFLQSKTSLCIANQLPKSFELTSITLQGKSLVSTFTGNGVELNDAALTDKGTCS
jgi:hypothetical protein